MAAKWPTLHRIGARATHPRQINLNKHKIYIFSCKRSAINCSLIEWARRTGRKNTVCTTQLASICICRVRHRDVVLRQARGGSATVYDAFRHKGDHNNYVRLRSQLNTPPGWCGGHCPPKMTIYSPARKMRLVLCHSGRAQIKYKFTGGALVLFLLLPSVFVIARH